MTAAKTNFTNILLPTDFSDAFQHSKAYAFALAKRFRGRVHIIHVENTGYMSYLGMYGQGVVVEPNLEKFRAEAESGMKAIVAEAKEKGIEADCHLSVGTPAGEIIRQAGDLGCDLIVISTHGRSGFDRFIMGSTAEAVVRRSPAPVLAVKHPEHEFVREDGQVRIERILCPCDFSDNGRAAAAYAGELCRSFGAALVLMHVLDERLDSALLLPAETMMPATEFGEHAGKILDELAEAQKGLAVEAVVEHGIPHRRIAEAVDTLSIDLIVMATHGYGAVLHALLGSTAEKVVRLAPCPVLTWRALG